MTVRLAVVLVLLAACSPSDTVRAVRPVPPTAHGRYAQALRDVGLDSTALGREWLVAADSALRTPLEAPLPAREIGAYSRSEARAIAYRVTLRDGQRLVATVRADGLRATLFLDLFEVADDSAGSLRYRASADTLARRDSAAALLSLEFEASRDGAYVVRLQPELLGDGRFELTLRTEPSLAFPVDGHGNRAIQSLFGVARDGGRRTHHGIDIFAPRGTPVLASTDGVVRSTDPNTLGGKVVWLGDERRHQTLYYAHLDSASVVEGQRVQRGDTLGFVGNTGNARTTKPHLHFGIYRRGAGPIDPLVHVRLASALPPVVRADTARLGRAAMTRAANATLRLSPTAGGTPVSIIPRNVALRIMGASAGWYRVQFPDGTTGYLTATAVGPVSSSAINGNN
jgi:murein DD-endopeptidase MepM/ murein hydrolase activator NlpD